MTLRSKILLVIGLLCAMIIVLAAFLIWQVTLSGYTKLERQSLERDLERADKALEAGLGILVIANRSFSYWNDTQVFVQGHDPDFPKVTGLEDNIFVEIDTDLVVFADTSGKIYYDRSVSSNKANALDEATLQVVRPLLVRDPSDIEERSGFMSLPAGPASVTALPILNNFAEGPAAGTLLVVRYLDEQYFQELDEAIIVSAKVTTLADAQVQDQTGLQNEAYLIQTMDRISKGYHLLPSPGGQSPLVLSVDATRTIYQQGLKNVLTLIATLALMSVVVTLIVAVLLERTILSRLSLLSKSVRRISESGDVTARTDLTGKDELAFLSADINHMLASLEHQEEALRKSNQELEQFAYIASHDLQEPLRKVQAFSDRLASKYADKLDDDGKLYISRMQDASNRMRILIQDLLTYSRVRSKGQEFVSVDLNEIVKGVIADLEVRLEQDGGRVEVDDLPTVWADPLQMRQVFQNLIGNALKFKKSGVVPIVRVMSKSKGSNYRIIVQDNGIGFEQQYAERIFEIFQRLHGRSDFEGTGMGLAIVKKILERHVGSIRAESEPGKGTRFILMLPNHDHTELANKATVMTPESAPRQDLPVQLEKELV
jgi:signal transduction histidine kinase